MSSEPKIKRKFRSFSISLKTTESDSTAIRFDDVAGGSLEIGTAASGFTALSFWASDSPANTFGRLRKTDGNAVSLTLSPSTAEARVYPFPDECYGVGAVKVVADHASGTAASCVVMLKG